jgi:two-component system, OmpR family, sensor histidine kinase KdpD
MALRRARKAHGRSSVLAGEPAIPYIACRDGRRTVRARLDAGVREVPRRAAPYLLSTLAVAAAVLVGKGLTTLAPLPNASMIFLLAVLFAAVVFGMWPAIYASLLSFLAYNFFLIPPLYSFTIAEPHELLALFIFLAVAIVAAALAGRNRDQARLAATRMRAMRRLYEFTGKLSAMATVDTVADGAAGEVHTSLGRPALIFVGGGDQLSLMAAWPPEDRLDAATMDAAKWAFACGEPAGAGTAVSPALPWRFVPLRTQRGAIGVLGVHTRNAPLDPEARGLLDTLTEQIAAALERASFAREVIETRAVAETERVRNLLLASISHDFRTPLASILGSATSLIDYRQKLDPSAQADLLGDIKQEAENLDGLVRNLLAITRIEAGGLELRLDWIDVREVVERVVASVRRRGAHHDIAVMLPPLPAIRADAGLIEQAIGNVVANAVHHTPPGTRIAVAARLDPEAIVVEVSDEGPGIPPDMLPRVFDKFVQRQREAGGREGTGLGLAIAKGVVEAHGGSIAAESPVNGNAGTRVVLAFPRRELRP